MIREELTMIKKTHQDNESCFPIHYISLNPKVCVIPVIPHGLIVQLKHHCYYEADVHDLLKDLKDKLERCYNVRSSENRNTCKDNKIGHRITFSIGNLTVSCWVIVDILEDRIALRLSYAGGEVICP